MKNITNSLLCLLFSVYSFGQCDYTLKMMDSVGDGWTGNTLDVLVDGVVILDNVTLVNGSEEFVTFPVTTDAEVTTIWNGGGSFASDASYEILDSDGAVAATGNYVANVSTGQCIAFCLVLEYCDSVPSSNDGQGITQILLASSTFTSGGDITYEDFTSPTVDVAQAVQTNLQITFATGYTYDTNIWIDFNNDSTFDNDTELVFDGESTNANPTTLDASFTVPNGTPNGVYNMRIGTSDFGQSTPDPCYNGSYGVTVDMRINVTAPPSCVPPTDLAVALNSSDSATVSWIAGGTETTWEYILQPQGTGAPNVAGTSISSNPLVLSGLNPFTNYEVYLRADCGSGDFSSWTGPVTFYTGYCESIPSSNDAQGITQIVLATSTFTSGGDLTYEDFTSPTVDVSQAVETNLQITFATGYTYDANVWIDFNNDLVYDSATELLFSGQSTNNNPTTLNASFTVPNGTANGVYNMRIGTAWLGQNPPDPCYNGSYGVTADMTVNVTAPPSCVPPTDLAVALNSSDSATLSWTAGATETVWEYVLQPQGTGAPTAAGTTTVENPLTLSGLSSGTAYEVFLRADCGAGDFSPWTGPVNFETGPACGDTIYDSGGATGEYSNNELITTTVFPENPGDVVTFTFISFETESCCDGLTVYNGPDTSFDSVDDEFRGAEIPDPITSTDPSGALTFVFDSDGSVTSAGYEILVSCGPPPSCLVPTNLTATLDALGTTATLNWDANNGETQWEYVLQPQGTGIPTTAGTLITTNPLTLSNLEWETDYEVYLRADCGEGDFSVWTSPAIFSTPVQTNYTIDCDAGEVLDLNYCYTNNDNTVWLFTSSTEFPVKIVFNSGNLESCCDEITIYDGSDNTGTVLFNNADANIHDLTGLEFQSTSTSMYIEVDSDGSVSCDSSTTYNPWDFSVSCATCVTQTVDFTINGVCSPYYEFYVDANISDMGDATSIDLVDNFGTTQTVATTGVVNFGPYAANEEIVINAVNTNDASCFVESDLLTFICPPPPNECSIIYAGEDSNLCADDDSTTTLTATYHILGQDTSAYEITSVNNCEFPSFLGGTPTSVETDDEWSDVIDIGFDFCFFGGTYNQLLIGSNGVISFDLTNANGYNGWSFSAEDTLPNASNSSLSDANIFGVAHDIDPSVGGEINFMILGSSPQRQFVVNYTEVPLFSGACNELTSTSQIILYESSNVIDVNIIDKPTCPTWNGGLAVVGIQNMEDTIAYTPSDRNTGVWETSGESWRFSPSVGTPNYLFEWYDGSNLVGTEQTITVSPETTTTYTAAITYDLCTGGTATVTDSVIVEIAQNPVPVAVEEQIALCYGEEQAVLEVYVDDSQQLPENIVYSWSYNDVVYVSEVSENDGGNILTLGAGEFDLLTGDYIVTAYNTVTGCASDKVISVTQGIAPELEDDTSFYKCSDGEVDLYVNITNDQSIDNTYEYDWYINDMLVSEGDSTGTFTHGEVYGYDSVLVVVTDVNSNCSSETTISINSYMNENCVDIPQGISPNGDGLNDCLVLDHLEDQEDIIKADVYNRYGTKVFELNDYVDQWCGQDASDGNINSNELLPVGTYFYIIQYASDREPTISWIYLNY